MLLFQSGPAVWPNSSASLRLAAVLPLPTVNSCDFVLADAIERTTLAKGAIGPHGGLVWDNTEADCCSSQLQARSAAEYGRALAGPTQEGMPEICRLAIAEAGSDLFVSHFRFAQVLDGKPHAHLAKQIAVRGPFCLEFAPQCARIHLQFLGNSLDARISAGMFDEDLPDLSGDATGAIDVIQK